MSILIQIFSTIMNSAPRQEHSFEDEDASYLRKCNAEKQLYLLNIFPLLLMDFSYVHMHNSVLIGNEGFTLFVYMQCRTQIFLVFFYLDILHGGIFPDEIFQIGFGMIQLQLLWTLYSF